MMIAFRAYDVGHLLDVDNKSLGWAASIVHLLLLRQISNNDPTGLWFKEGRESFRFGLDEFCLITGLRGFNEEDVEIPENDTLIDRYFPEMSEPNTKKRNQAGRAKISLSDLH